MNKEKILVVDLDNSLLKIDIFKEILGKSLIYSPLKFIKTILLSLNNRAVAKEFLLKDININFSKLPFNQMIINLLSEYKKKGYKIILATGSIKKAALGIADKLKIFDDVLFTEGDINNIGSNKLEKIIKKVSGEFIYLGDSKKDLPIWLYCKKAILIGDNSTIEKKLKSSGIEIIDIIKDNKSFINIASKQLRIHQWSKNILLFVPAITSYKLLVSNVFLNTLQGFFAFSLLASGIYILNDILDIDFDREHPKKKNRPIASGDISIFQGYILLVICFSGSFFLTSGLGNVFYLIVCTYIIFNLLYSLKLKQFIVLDVILLMTFYTLRLIAGHAINNISLSPWLLSFTIFLFFSLGLLKRYIDTIIIRKDNSLLLTGRGYFVDDGNMMMSLGVSSGIISVLVLILYTGSEQVQQYYSTPMILNLIAPIMLYWISRIWFMAGRGDIQSDPVLFALKDIPSYVVFFLFLTIMFLSKNLVF
jgi:4-hydroxybenzoate polyprenyltransferase/phosphoserine phosphatase